MPVLLKSPYPDVAAPAVITSGLIFALAFAEGSGQTIAAAHGTSYGAVLGSTSGADANDPDWVTAGLDFVPGTSDLVTASSVPDTGWLGALSVQVVARIDALVANLFVQKIGGDGSGTTQTPLLFSTDFTASNMRIYLSRANTTFRVHTSANIGNTLGTYRCYGATMAATMQTAPTFYLNGAPVAYNTTTGTGTGAPTGASSNVVLGRKPVATTRQMDGTISYVVVYDRLLSAAEIADNYLALKAIMAARSVTLP